jgi:TatD DNase family protein
MEVMTSCDLIDIHLHLCRPELLRNLDELLLEAAQVGVRKFAVNTTRPEDWPLLAKMAGKHPSIMPFYGLHPWFVRDAEPGWQDTLRSYLEDPRAGIGEIGLDRWVEPRDEQAQHEAFVSQLELARRLHRPACIHCLRAWGPMMEILGQADAFPAGLCFHAFGGSVEILHRLIDKNAYFSFAGDTLKPKYKTKREALGEVPDERILVETDAPDMLPPDTTQPASVRGERGRKHNVPRNLPLIVEGLAELRSMRPCQLASVTYANSLRLLQPLADPRA